MTTFPTDRWYTRVWRSMVSPTKDVTERHPLLERMAAIRCNPLLDSLNLYVSTDSIAAALMRHDRRFDASLKSRIARTKLHRTEWTD